MRHLKIEARNRLIVKDCKEKGKGKGIFATANKNGQENKMEVRL
jgi:hypothetical protein